MRRLEDDIILKTIVGIVTPLIFVFGIYVILNGHISPGGGFSGGTIFGAGIIAFQAAFGTKQARKIMNFKLMTRIVSGALLFYACAKGYSFFMGASHFDAGIPKGVPGNIISAGLILPLNIAVGIVVACTIYGLYALFSEGEV